MLNSFVSRKTFLVRSQEGKKVRLEGHFLFTQESTISVGSVRQNPEHFPKLRTTYNYFYE